MILLKPRGRLERLPPGLYQALHVFAKTAIGQHAFDLVPRDRMDQLGFPSLRNSSWLRLLCADAALWGSFERLKKRQCGCVRVPSCSIKTSTLVLTVAFKLGQVP